MNVSRLRAYRALLALPDKDGGRQHHVTHAGARDRWTRTLQPAVRAWLAAEVARHEGAADGWRLRIWR